MFDAMKKILILADDLTGANDTAIQFAKRGIPCLVIVKAEMASADLFDKYDCLSVSSDSRGLDAAEAYKVVYKTVKQIGAGFFVYKKVDSVLRGNPGQELGAVMDALDISLALAAPSFPANRSLLENGILNGKTDAVQVFANRIGRKTENIPLEVIRNDAAAEFINSHSDTQVFVADAVTDEDLEIICKTSASLEPHVLTGSAGLANQLARRIGKAEVATLEKPFVLSPALIIAGTRQGETAVQINTLCRAFAVAPVNFNVRLVAEGKAGMAITAAYDEASRHANKNAGLYVIAVESMFHSAAPSGQTINDYIEGDETCAAISTALGILAEKLMDSFQFPVMLSTGGDTSLAICERLGINAIKPLTEICPGIPLGRIVGGPYEGRFIITKSGRFGNPDSLVETVKYLGVKQ